MAYEAGFQAGDSPLALDCELGRGRWRVRGAPAGGRGSTPPGGLRRRHDAGGGAADLHRPAGRRQHGTGGKLGCRRGALTDDGPARFERIAAGRTAIFTGGRAISLPDHRDGWQWEPHAVEGSDIEVARQQLRRLMRDAESTVAEELCDDGWLTVLDGPLYGIRRRRRLPFLGYVKTHHRRLLATDLWMRVPGPVGRRMARSVRAAGRPVCVLSAGRRPGTMGRPLGGHRAHRDAGGDRPRGRGWRGRRSGGLAAGVRLGPSPGRAGAGEPDPDRGPGAAPAPSAGRRPAGVAGGARVRAAAQPRGAGSP